MLQWTELFLSLLCLTLMLYLYPVCCTSTPSAVPLPRLLYFTPELYLYNSVMLIDQFSSQGTDQFRGNVQQSEYSYSSGVKYSRQGTDQFWGKVQQSGYRSVQG